MPHTDPTLVTEIVIDAEAPSYGQSASGFGGKVPTRYRIRYAGRMRRVYVMVYGNDGSAYIVVKGVDTFIDTDTEYSIYDARDNK